MYYMARVKKMFLPKSTITLTQKAHKHTCFQPIFCVPVSKQTFYSIDLVFRTVPQCTSYLILCEQFLKCSVDVVETTSYIYVIRDNSLCKNCDV